MVAEVAVWAQALGVAAAAAAAARL